MCNLPCAVDSDSPWTGLGDRGVLDSGVRDRGVWLGDLDGVDACFMSFAVWHYIPISEPTTPE